MPTSPIGSREQAPDYPEPLVAGGGRLPTVVLVHGTGSDATQTWGHMIPSLGRERKVIAPCLCRLDAAKRDPLELAELVAVVLEAANRETAPFDLIGYSLGAVVAAACAATVAKRVRRLVLIAGWRTSRDPRVQLQFELWRRLYDHDRRALAQLLTLTAFSPDWLTRLSPDEVAARVAATEDGMTSDMPRQAELDQRIDITSRLARVRHPTLVIGAAHDQMVPVGHARDLARHLPQARYVELDAGHAVLEERADEVLEAIVAFLDDTTVDSRPSQHV